MLLFIDLPREVNKVTFAVKLTAVLHGSVSQLNLPQVFDWVEIWRLWRPYYVLHRTVALIKPSVRPVALYGSIYRGTPVFTHFIFEGDIL